MKNIIFVLFLTTSFLYGFGNQYIKISSEKERYSLDDTIEVTVKIVADHEISLEDMPKVENLTLTGTPLTSTMQNYSYVNGVVTSKTTVIYKLTYMPVKVGIAKVGPIRIKSRGRLFVSNVLKLTILKPNDLKNLTDDDFKYPFDPELFIAAKVDKSEVYLGEQVIVTYELYHRIDVNFAEQPVIPSYKNFWIEELDDNNNSIVRSRRKIYKGYYFKVTPIAKRALFPIKTGELILPPFKAKFKADIFSFGISPDKIYNRSSNLVKIKVKPLPQKGKPDEFPEGNVGDYVFTVSVSKNKVKVNEPFTVNLTVKGKGNIKNVTLPKIKDIKGFKIYEPTEKINITNRGLIKGSKTVSYVLKAEKPGKFKSFDLKFKFFNPETKRYRVIDYGDLEIEVTGKPAKNNKNTLNNDKNNEKSEGNDGFHKISVSLKPISDTLGKNIDNDRYLNNYILLLVVLILFPGIYLFVLLYFKRKYRHISNKDIILMKNAAKKALSSLKTLEKNNPSSKDFYGELHTIIITYIEEKFSIAARGLTIEQIAVFLEEKNLTEEYIKVITDTLENCQYIRYSNLNIEDSDKKESIKAVRYVINEIEKGE